MGDTGFLLEHCSRWANFRNSLRAPISGPSVPENLRISIKRTQKKICGLAISGLKKKLAMPTSAEDDKNLLHESLHTVATLLISAELMFTLNTGVCLRIISLQLHFGT